MVTFQALANYSLSNRPYPRSLMSTDNLTVMIGQRGCLCMLALSLVGVLNLVSSINHLCTLTVLTFKLVYGTNHYFIIIYVFLVA